MTAAPISVLARDRLTAVIERLDRCDPGERADIIAGEVIEADGTFQRPQNFAQIDGMAEIRLHDISAFGLTYHDAAEIWHHRARSAIGGFPEPAHALRGPQIAWATYCVTHPSETPERALRRACAIIIALSDDWTLRDRATALATGEPAK